MSANGQRRFFSSATRRSAEAALGRAWDSFHELIKDWRAKAGLTMLLIIIGIGIIGPFVAPYSPFNTSFTAWQPPSSAHPFGTDYIGEDVLSWFLVGTATSLYVGFIIAVSAAALGTLVGVVAGYFGSIVDDALMRFVDVLLIIPGFPLLVILSAYFPPTVTSTIIILSILSWPFLSRVIRSQTLTLKQRPYIMASKLSGLGSMRIIWRDIIPNLLPLIFINVIFLVVGAVVTQAGLAFFGLGDLKSVNWGTMLYWFEAQDGIVYDAWWWLLPPGFGILVLAVGANFLSNAVSAMTNKTRR